MPAPARTQVPEARAVTPVLPTRLGAPRGTLAGSVIDATTERGLVGATVVIYRRSSPTVPVRELRSDDGGHYRATSLPVGSYLVQVRAIGYKPAELVVHLVPDASYTVSVGLQVQPFRLQPVVVEAATLPTFGRMLASRADADLRLRVDSIRRRHFLTPETHAITAADVRDAVTFGDADIVRALQRVPGVSTRDEYTAALWTRGAPWAHTSVTFDGVPVFNGLHAAGLVSAFNPDAVGSAVFHVGVQPAVLAGGAAGLLELTSRRASGKPRLATMAELTLLSGRIAFDRTSGDGATGVAVAVRRSHLDLSPRGLRILDDVMPASVPYAFGDLAVRVDRRLGRGWTLDASSLLSRDDLWGDVPGVVERSTARWGGAAAQVSIQRPAAGGILRHSLAYSTFFANVASHDTSWIGAIVPGYVVGECGCVYETDETYIPQPTSNRIAYAAVRTSWDRAGADGPELSVGAELVRHASRFATSGAWPLGGRPGTTRASSGRDTHASLWAERTLHLGPLAVRGGGRVDLTPVGAAGVMMRAAPRVSTRLVAGRTVLSASFARTHQYAQTIAPHGLGRTTIATADMFWIVAGDGSAPATSDFASAAVEWRLTDATSAGVTLFTREGSSLAVADPRPGRRLERELHVTGEQHAAGVEVWLRRLAGRVTPSIGYSNGTSVIEAEGLRYAAPSHRRHVLRAGTGVQLTGALRASAQFTMASGAPFTRYYFGGMKCVAGTCEWAVPPLIGPPSEDRTAGLRGLDLSAEWTGRIGDVRTGIFAQGHNLFGAARPVTYLNSHGWCDATGMRRGSCDWVTGRWQRIDDISLPALRRVVTAGVRVAF